jgi:hypothetical protein
MNKKLSPLWKTFMEHESKIHNQKMKFQFYHWGTKNKMEGNKMIGKLKVNLIAMAKINFHHYKVNQN